MERVPKDFALALRAARMVRGFTLRDIATRTGVPVGRLSGFERGRIMPEADEFAAVWGALTTDPPRAGSGRPHAGVQEGASK